MTDQDPFSDGWWLMSVAQLERYLAAWRAGDPAGVPEGIERLTIDGARDYRDRGNVPDAADRSLRLVLRVDDEGDLLALDSKRLRYEPDAHQAPTWRRAESRPINVVPLRAADVAGPGLHSWWDDPAMAEMEKRWQETGEVDGLAIPEEFRGFVYKTLVALRGSGAQVTPDAVADSIARWLDPVEAERLRAALRSANPDR